MFLLTGPSSGGVSPSRKEQPLFTLRQVGMICERLLKEREDKVREEYEETMTSKLAGSYFFNDSNYAAFTYIKQIISVYNILSANSFFFLLISIVNHLHYFICKRSAMFKNSLGQYFENHFRTKYRCSILLNDILQLFNQLGLFWAFINNLRAGLIDSLPFLFQNNMTPLWSSHMISWCGDSASSLQAVSSFPFIFTFLLRWHGVRNFKPTDLSSIFHFTSAFLQMFPECGTEEDLRLQAVMWSLAEEFSS